MTSRLNIAIRGAVQGVGFRPFVYRLAQELRLTGFVMNTGDGVTVDVEGEQSAVDAFLLRINKEKPPRSFIQSLEARALDASGYSDFSIRESDSHANPTALIMSDIGTCSECAAEIFDPSNRRYLYPFTNCTNCGPRFSIIASLPYDRIHTTMKSFVMCDMCRREYEDPLNRRFHAQPNACPVCGPHLEMWNTSGDVMASQHRALLESADHIRKGDIVAVKGIGGFHLIVDARNESAVLRLRERKHREEKPLAVMYPSLTLVRQEFDVSPLEARLLTAPEAPIVILKRTGGLSVPRPQVCRSVAPGNPNIGVMLPYTPLHHILMRECGFPVVATSGNFSEEPICIDERDAVDRLGCIADVLLVHDRPIRRHVDDSVVRVMAGRELVLRRARGFAPLPVRLKMDAPPLLATGPHLKNTVAVTSGRNVFVSQHIGDLETGEAYEAFRSSTQDLTNLFDVRPQIIVADLHPGYLSTQYAKKAGNEVEFVQHHAAHIYSCMAENELEGTVLGVSWDGTGYGTDGTAWGGEFLRVGPDVVERFATFRPFRLPGGDSAAREPRRSALGALYELFGPALLSRSDIGSVTSFTRSEQHALLDMLDRGINSPKTSSVGRLFDVVASLTGVRHRTTFEGQAAAELEFAMGNADIHASYPFSISSDSSSGGASLGVIDWAPIVRAVLADVESGVPIAIISSKFHNALSESVIEIARRAGQHDVVLSGGCFQNRYLTERTISRLVEEGFHPYWHQRIPPNDGGISLGQIYGVALRSSRPQSAIGSLSLCHETVA